tara:strand:+ start:206 stop:400 length:195 start_codon:yes stop_codon:yes gene_type:complete
MKTYTITRTTNLKISKEFDSDEKLMNYFYGGVVNMWLEDKKDEELLSYLITDEDDNVVFKHTYT